MKKRILATLLSLCLVIGLLPVTAMAASITYIDDNADKRTLQGDGTAENPYLISSADDLDRIRYYIVNTGLEEGTSTDKNGVTTTTTINSQVIDGYFKLATDIDCSSVAAWVPIGRTDANQAIRYKTAFVGTLDGDGHTISNLTLSTAYSGIGLFTRVGKGGTIKNLTIDICTTGTGSTTQEVGAVCGTAWGATFSNITLKNITIYGGGYAGALSGDIWTIDEVGTTVTNCSVQDSTISGGAATGGMFGRTHAQDTLTGCTVSDTNVTASGHSVAGLAGILGGPSENCHTTNVGVTSTMSGTAYAGGLFGQGSSTLTNCSASGTVSAGVNGQQAGGLGAYYTGSKIENCSANVNVDAKNHVGGLIGFISGTTEVKNCHATGAVTITAATSDNHSAGGLIGRIKGDTITNCYATGNVTDRGATVLSGTGNDAVGIGGLIGKADASAITGSYATGAVTDACTVAGGFAGYSSSQISSCYATGNVTGAGQSGGFAGYVASGTITDSYATGTVTGATPVGGFVGYVSNGATISSAAASGNVTATKGTDGIAGGFIGSTNGAPSIKNALALGTVSAAKAGAFIGTGAALIKGLENCYTNSESAIPFTYSFSGYYSPQNCFYGGNVTGMLASGQELNGSEWQNYDYYYAKMNFADITGSYGDALSLAQTNTIGSNVTDKTPKHNLTVKVSPETLVTVGNDGALTAAGIGTGTLSLVLTVNGEDFAFGTANVTVSPKAVAVTMSDKTGENAETYDGTAKTITVNETTLPNDLNLVYSYKVATAEDSTYTTTPPTDAGTYTVKVETSNPNYTLTDTTTTTATLTINSASLSGAAVTPKQNVFPYTGSAITPDVTVVLGGKTLVKDQDYTVAYSNNTSAGTATITVTGKGNYIDTATGSFTISNTAPTVTAEDVSVTYDATAHGLNVTTSSGTVSYYSDSALNTEFTGATNAGTYTVYYKITGAAGLEGSVTGYATLTITPATLTITADNKSMYVNGTLPTYTYTVSGWQGSDSTLTTEPTMACEADGKTAGTYTITASGADAGDNYAITYVSGTLNVYTRSSGGSSSSSTSTSTSKNPDGSTTTTTTNKSTGVTTETTKLDDGTTGTVVTDKNGNITEVKATVSSTAAKEAAKTGEAVTLPVEVSVADTTEDAPAVQVTVPKSAGSVKVEIPVENITPGTVAVIVKADGTEEIVKTSVLIEDGVVLKLEGSATVKVIDNAKDFSDNNGHWAADYIDFVTARGMFSGTTETTFTPDAPMTRSMMWTVLARFDDEDISSGSVWYEKGMEWAKANGVSDGSNPNGSITREQLAMMLWRYSGSPVVEGGVDSFNDAGKVSDYASDAMRWAVETGLIGGVGNNTLAPQGNATRAQLATILMRYCENIVE